MTTLQDLIAGYQALPENDRIALFHFLGSTKDKVLIERDEVLRNSWKRKFRDTPPEPPASPVVPAPPVIPQPQEKEPPKMAIESEIKSMFDAMQKAMQDGFGAMTQNVTAMQEQIKKNELSTYREKLLDSRSIPKHLAGYVTGDSVDALNAAADSVLSVYASIEEEMKAKYAVVPPAPTAIEALVAGAPTPGAAPAPAPTAPAGGGVPSAVPPTAPSVPGAVAPQVLNPLAPPPTDPVLPGPPAGLGAGQQITQEELAQVDYERYAEDPALRQKIETDLKARLGNKPLFVSSN